MLKTRILLLIGIGLFMVLLFLTPSFLPAKAVPVLDLSVNAEEEVTKGVKEKKKITSVQWKGNIYRDLETHYYLFSTTKKGTINVIWGPNTDGSDFIITDQNWGAMYGNGDVLPAGEYMFVVTSNPIESPEDPSLLTYEFTLKGLLFKEAPNTTLPQLLIESPVDLVTHLPEGDHTITFKGRSDADFLLFGTSGFGDEMTENLTSSFEKNIVFNENSQAYNFFRISATNDSGNAVNRYFEVLYEGGIRE
ncbi:hypothetical protein M3175_08775 [Robertmurraya korlensis]|uniref:hypothetical protein n=1 Tax=Robertmurraya korlensis TaxID=519977 RepID=UPI00203C9205|nr:hypothetical protein [Robertmurraya korlensis]MCM3600822.1 hypothetical protein [Robertmurraya korlensis]